MFFLRRMSDPASDRGDLIEYMCSEEDSATSDAHIRDHPAIASEDDV